MIPELDSTDDAGVDKLHLLLIEDDDIDAEVVQQMLDTCGEPIAVTRRCSVSAMKEVVTRADFDLVLLDLTLPDGDGLLVIQELQAITSGLPFVVLSEGENSDAIEILKVGAQDCLDKNDLTKERLLRAIRYSIARFRSIKELRSTNEELRRQSQIAQATSGAKTDLLATMSHEIRTPLTAVVGFADTLLNDPDALTEEERIETLESIVRNGRHLSELINNILDVSKMDAEKVVLEQRAVDLRALLSDVTKMVTHRHQSDQVSLVVDIDEDIPASVITDSTRLTQVLVNLLGNAFKFTSQGNVTLRCDATATSPNTYDVSFAISDTGIGIDESRLDEIFMPFVQADETTNRRYGGTGLGLSISRGIAEALGGTLEATSCVGEGSTFTLRIPLTVTTSPDRSTSGIDGQSTLSSSPRPLAGKSVLLAEDGVDNQRLISLVLKRAGADVVVVDNGLAAVQRLRDSESKAQENCFDVVLMDMQMPKLNGYDATRQIRVDGCDTPIIALTAHSMAGDRERCLEAGCNDYETKPINRQELVALTTQYANAATRHGAHGLEEDISL